MSPVCWQSGGLTTLAQSPSFFSIPSAAAKYIKKHPKEQGSNSAGSAPAAAFTRPGQEHRAGNLGPEGGDRGGSGAAWPSTTCRASHPITSQHLASPGLLLPSPKRARGRPHHAPGAPSAASGPCCPHPPHPVPPCHGTRGRFTTRSCSRRIQRVHDMNYKSPSREEAARSRLSHCSYLSLSPPPLFFWRLITILWIFSTKGHLFECICFFINVC